MDLELEGAKGESCGESSPGCSSYSSMVHSKKVIKHALRQQAKRRRKNTTIAAGNSRTLPRIVVKPLPPPPPDDPPSPVNNLQHSNAAAEEPAATMREVLASLPGFSLKSGRRRSTKRLSAAAQLEAGLVDLESPASILASTSLRALLNRHTFQGLPPLYQRKLAQLLPAVDRQDAATSGLNNEFFARACLEWRKRLAEGEFTPENQQRLKMEAERDKNKLDPWKLKHFEPIWGEKHEPKLRSGPHCTPEPRSGGAVTRSSLRLRLEANPEQIIQELAPCPVPVMEEKVESKVYVPEVMVNNSYTATENQEMQLDSPQRYEGTVQILEDVHKTKESTNQNSTTLVVQVHASQSVLLEEQITHIPDEQLTQTTEMQDTQIPTDEITQISEEQVPQIPEQQITQIPEEQVIRISEEQSIRMAEEQAIRISEEQAIRLSEEQAIGMSEEQAIGMSEEQAIEISEEQAIGMPERQVVHLPEEQVAQILEDQHEHFSQMSEEHISQMSEEHVSQMSEEHVSQMSEEHISQMSESDNNIAMENPSPCDDFRVSDTISEDRAVLNDHEEAEVTVTVATDAEPQIPEGMEIDSETLQRIHELEVRGEMEAAFVEISGPEEMYPILEGMEMGSAGAEEAETQGVADQGEGAGVQQEMNSGNEEDAFIDANNYVLESREIRSEMLECSWAVDPTVGTVNNVNRTQEELQVPWPLVAAALDGSVAANITVTTQDECTDTSTPSEAATITQQTVNPDANATETVNCVQLPVVQGASFPGETLSVGTPVTSCILSNGQSPSPPIIAFPQLQSIRFVQTSFHPGQNTVQTLTNTNSVPVQIQNQPNPPPQVGIVRTQEEVLQIGSQNVVAHNNVQNNVVARSQAQNNAPPVCVQPQTQARTQNTIVVQHQTPIATQPRQVVATVQQQQYPVVTVSSRSGRATGQGGQRNSRGSNKEQGSGRSRSSTKEPPGAVNLERSYQICQAVIQSSPNRDQLKAHLKPPPSLLARGDGAFTTSKPGGRTVTTVKTQKAQQVTQHGKPTPNKAQAVMLRHVFATARQPVPTELTENGTVAQLGPNGAGGLGQYILVQRTGVGDGAPRASSAPPLPPQIAGMGVGVHLVRGRPASAGEGSHQAVTLKARGASDGRGGGGAEPGAPGVIMGGDPPPPCECNMRGAMVICRQCGAFCHDDCIGPQRICATCLIR